MSAKDEAVERVEKELCTRDCICEMEGCMGCEACARIAAAIEQAEARGEVQGYLKGREQEAALQKEIRALRRGGRIGVNGREVSPEELAEARGSAGLLRAAEYVLDEWESGAGLRKAGFVALREQVRALKRGGRE